MLSCSFFVKSIRRGSALFCAFLVFVCAGTSAGAQSVDIPKRKISLNIPDEYIILDSKNASDYKEMLNEFNIDVENFGDNLKKSGTLLFAVSPDGKYQINLKEITSEISGEIYDLTILTEENRESVKNEIIGGLAETGNMTVLETRETEVCETLFYRVTVRVSTGTGEFCFVQYFSIWNGKYYALVFYNSAPELTEDELSAAETVFAGMQLERKVKAGTLSAVFLLQMILIGALIAGGTFFTGYIIFTLIRDFKAARAEKENRLNQIRRK